MLRSADASVPDTGKRQVQWAHASFCVRAHTHVRPRATTNVTLPMHILFVLNMFSKEKIGYKGTSEG